MGERAHPAPADLLMKLGQLCIHATAIEPLPDNPSPPKTKGSYLLKTC
jgi:hypothetical protein